MTYDHDHLYIYIYHTYNLIRETSLISKGGLFRSSPYKNKT